MQEKKTIIYYDELNDEFSDAKIQPIKIDASYRYTGRPCFKLRQFFSYRVILKPLGYLYLKLKYRHKFVYKDKNSIPKKGAFMYGNHTNSLTDPFIPALLCGHTYDYVVVHPSNVSIPFLGRVLPYAGAIPLPDDLAATRNFTAYIKQVHEENHIITIYPEAHIWPYYTKIRPFKDASFGYPIKHKAPVYCFTNTYQKRKHSKNPRMVTYVSGPYYPDPSLSVPAARKDLRDRVYAQMVEDSRHNTIEMIHYVKGSKTDKESINETN